MTFFQNFYSYHQPAGAGNTGSLLRNFQVVGK